MALKVTSHPNQLKQASCQPRVASAQGGKYSSRRPHSGRRVANCLLCKGLFVAERKFTTSPEPEIRLMSFCSELPSELARSELQVNLMSKRTHLNWYLRTCRHIYSYKKMVDKRKISAWRLIPGSSRKPRLSVALTDIAEPLARPEPATSSELAHATPASCGDPPSPSGDARRPLSRESRVVRTSSCRRLCVWVRRDFEAGTIWRQATAAARQSFAHLQK